MNKTTKVIGYLIHVFGRRKIFHMTHKPLMAGVSQKFSEIFYALQQ